MPESAFTTWLAEAIGQIPLRSEPLFEQLWAKRRLCYSDGSASTDLTDQINSRLAALAKERNRRFFIVLPDTAPHRAPVLFATALLADWWGLKEAGIPSGNLLYFGSAIGIRSHLARIRIGSLHLDTVFPQSAISTTGRALHVASKHPSLPQVICAYSPADPVSLFKQYKPQWLAIDCGEDAELRWIAAVLEYSSDKGIPFIAWGCNPLSEVVNQFECTGAQIFRWPQRLHCLGSSSETDWSDSSIEVAPMVIDAPGNAGEIALRKAYYALARTSKPTVGRLARDALQISWALQRALEGLSVPFGFYEAEVAGHWGMKRITILRDGVEGFIEAVQSNDLALHADLQEVLSYQETAIHSFSNSEPPLWSALTHLCIEDGPEDAVRMLVFPNAARKQLFALALLARYNFTEDDLREIGVQLRTVRDFHDGLKSSGGSAPKRDHLQNSAGSTNEPLRQWPLLVGLPSVVLSRRLLPVLRCGGLGAIVHPYQVSALAKRVDDWNTALGANVSECREMILNFSAKYPATEPPVSTRRVMLMDLELIQVAGGEVRSVRKAPPLLKPLDELEEIRWLLDEDQILPEEQLGSAGDNDLPLAGQGEESVWIPKGIQVRLVGGWSVLFATDETVNVIVGGATGDQVEQRFVKSLRPGDRILFIHGQKRQSLYQLIISRVHNHPALEMHLALIRKWQEEFAQANRQRHNSGWDVEEILRQIKKRGSGLTSHQTIRLWLQGRVLCPDDPEDLARLAEAMDMPFVHQHHQRIFHAAQRIRGLHRGLSTRLNNWLQDQANGIVNEDASFEVFDRELGLSLQDFRDSLMILHVSATEYVTGPFLRNTIGTLVKE